MNVNLPEKSTHNSNENSSKDYDNFDIVISLENNNNNYNNLNEKKINLIENKEENVNDDYFILSALESIIINKFMPKGFKIESEFNLQKQEDSKNKVIHRKHHRSTNTHIEQNSPKKIRKKPENNISSTINSNISENNTSNNKENESIPYLNKKSMRIHKPKIKEDLGYIDKNVIQGKSNPLRVSISKKCEKALFQIKKLENFDYLYSKNSNYSSDIPSISKIEKNIKNYKYQSSYEFINDLRRLWGFYYKNLLNPPMYEQRIGNLIRNSEQILNNLELFNAEKSEMIEINKKIDNLEREITNIKRNKNYNINNFNNNNNYNLSLKRAISGEKSFSFAEKSIIKANINKLTLEQKKGIVNVLGDVLNTTNKKIVEFDIEKLGNKKLRELEKYVMDCLQKNMEKKAQNINNLIQIKNEQNNNSNINSSHNQSEIETNKKLDIENDNFSNTSDDDDESESSSLSSLK